MTETTRIFRVVYYDEDSGVFCQCQGSFWKTCPLRAANDLPCQESVVSITPVDRSGPQASKSPASSLDPKLRDVADKLRELAEKGFFK